MEDAGRVSHRSNFGKLLRRYRLAAGLSQEALAERAKLSVDGVSALERGHRRSPQRETLALLAGALALDAKQRLELEAAAARPRLPRRAGGSITVGPWTDSSVGSLPISPATFIGRSSELQAIAELVRAYRLVTITGAAGAGKTQTALRVADMLGDDTSVCFVGLASVSDPALVSTAIASALGVQESPNRRLLDTLIAYLRKKTLLLLLDNCEHVIGTAARDVHELLAGCAQLRILATSREPLMSEGERRYRLPQLRPQDAIELFADRAQAVDVHFTLSGENGAFVGDICRQLDGLPLAIELAAARVSSLSLAAIHGKLDDRLRILTGGRPTALPHQRTMRATIDWSYDLLSTAEQLVFERLSIFAGGARLTEAETVCAGTSVAQSDVLDLLGSLVDKSLVAVDFERHEPRYGMLESFRQYAREKLAARGELTAAAHRHATVYLQLAERVSSQRVNEPTEVSHEQWFFEQDNFRNALQWALTERGDVQVGLRLAAEACYWEFFAAPERRRWMDAALALAGESTPAVLASLHRANSIVSFHLRDYETAAASGRIAFGHYRAVGDPTGTAQAANAMGYALWNMRRTVEARETFENALPVARAGQSHTALAGILAGLATATDDIEAARRYVTEALKIHEASGNKIGVAYSLVSLGICENRAGNRESALAHTKQALSIAAELPAFAGVNVTTLALFNLSTDLIVLGRYDEAEQCVRQRLELALEYGLDYHIDTSLEH
jgi:predicted ATPase/transcriptional regulator with XRE-family HTH domain